MRAVIVEDLALVRDGIVALLRENGVDVVAQADDGPGLERIVAGHVRNIFAKLDLPASNDDPRRVLAVPAYLRTGDG